MICRDCERDSEETTFRRDRRTRSGWSLRCEPCRTGTREPCRRFLASHTSGAAAGRPSLDAVVVLARQLLPQDRAHLVELIDPHSHNYSSMTGPSGLVAIRKNRP